MKATVSLDERAWAELVSAFDKRTAEKTWRNIVKRNKAAFSNETLSVVDKRINLPKTGKKTLWRKFHYMKTNLKGQLPDINLELVFRKSGPELIHFVQGRKRPMRQKGIKVAARKPIKVEVLRGKRDIAHNAFIAKTSTGYHVFRRGKNKKGSTKTKTGKDVLKLQRGKILWTMVKDQAFVSAVARKMSGKMSTEFLREYRARLSNPEAFKRKTK